jgi:hypothetical protein
MTVTAMTVAAMTATVTTTIAITTATMTVTATTDAAVTAAVVSRVAGTAWWSHSAAAVERVPQSSPPSPTTAPPQRERMRSDAAVEVCCV